MEDELCFGQSYRPQVLVHLHVQGGTKNGLFWITVIR